MEAADRKQIQSTFETWNRETLLDELTQRGQDFTPEARELLHAELLSRGVSEGAIEHAREVYRAALAEREIPMEELRTVETFDDHLSASAARDLLDQAGIPAEVLGSDRLLFGPGLLGIGPRPITLKVVEHNLDRARQVLEDFAPALDSPALDGDETRGA